MYSLDASAVFHSFMQNLPIRPYLSLRVHYPASPQSPASTTTTCLMQHVGTLLPNLILEQQQKSNNSNNSNDDNTQGKSIAFRVQKA
jgi:hypothetical protein